MTKLIHKITRWIITDIGTRNDLTRDKWVRDALLRLPKGFRLLDAGAGQGRYRKYCAHLNYASQDFCKYNGAGDGRALQTGIWDTGRINIVSDIDRIPVEDCSFDAVLCTEVLEHIPDPVSAIKEFYRLLKPGGELILTAPFSSLTHMAPYHFYSGFNRYFYEHYLPGLGFTISEITANGDYAQYAGQELRRVLTMYDKIPFYIKACVAILLRFIGVRRNKINSDDGLLCFGYHVRAVKKGSKK